MLSPTALPSVSWMLISCLMLLSQVQGEEPQNKQSSPRTSCPKGSVSYASHCYALFTIPKTWFDANVSD
ncbi:regenerating islet-derived protein 3-alpha-like [Tupaia chinensis]|uniref:regenerating islet-derived protein 3-alpha-like n=1 Tax=Tupaia chinensis TaxID=246437 RepID=UPI0003C923B0|nr:regenerating islet-derived protein 3-alpha-like [Tupaia chinensis]